jgi:glycosyltransferase involved in cell wall biosynthesis
MKIEVLIISPSLLEPATKRGGGIEEIDYQVASQISNDINVQIIGPRFENSPNSLVINEKFSIKELKFPAINHYPPISFPEVAYWTFIIEPLYAFIIFLYVLRCKSCEPKIVMVHNGLIGFAASIAARIKKRRIVYSEGNAVPWVDIQRRHFLRRIGFIYNFILGISIARISKVIRVQSKAIQDGMISKGVNHDKIKMIPGGVVTAIYDQEIQSFENAEFIDIAYIGRLVEEKGAGILFETVKHAIDELPEAKFHVFGDGPYAEKLRALKNVAYIGSINRDMLPNQLRKVRIVFSFERIIGLAELEAMAAGKVVVALNCPEVASIIKNNENGILCSGNPECYLNAVRELQNNIEKYYKIAMQARFDAIAKFSWDKLGREWNALFRELLDEKS